MTGRAITVEIFFAALRISGLQIRYRYPAAPSGMLLDVVPLIVNKSDHATQVLFGEFEARHSLLRPAIAHHCADFVALDILGNKLRIVQRWPRLAPARIPPMAKRAILLKQRPAISNNGFRLGLRGFLRALS